MGTKEFTKEQLDVLASLVLSEIVTLEEFSKKHIETAKKALEPKIENLHALYIYLIA